MPPGDAEVTPVNDGNFLLYAPLLPGVGGGTLEPRHVVVPLREELRRTEVRVGRVLGADPARRTVRVESPAGAVEELDYDQLVVALGSVSKHPPIAGLDEHALPFKTVADALALRNRVIASLERAEEIDDPEERGSWLSYVFAGGGYTGVEALAELEDFATDLLRLYPRCARQGMRWTLVEGEPRIMSREMPPVETDTCMRVSGHEGVWAIGDAAAVPEPAAPGRACPQTAQHALRQGRTVARNVADGPRGSAAATVRVPDEEDGRRARAPQGRRQHRGTPAARRSGLARGPHVPPGGDARQPAARAADARLGARDRLRAGLGGAKLSLA